MHVFDLSKTGISKVRPAELFLKNIYTHFEPQLDRIMSEMCPSFCFSKKNEIMVIFKKEKVFTSFTVIY